MASTKTRTSAKADLVYNPFDHATAFDPYPVYKRLRDEAPVYHNPEVGFWALSRYDDVLAAHLDTATFSSAQGVTMYAEPEYLDIHRDVRRHVSFGFGPHLCLGAALARLESRVALDEFLNAFPEYAIDDSGVVRAHQSNVRGLQHLPIVAEPAGSTTSSA